MGIDEATACGFFKDPDFLKRLDQRKQVWVEDIRAVAMERAKEKSDTLMIFLLKSLQPERYDDEIRRTRYLADNDMASPDAAPVQVSLVRDEAPEGVEVVGEAEAEQEH